MIQQFRIKRAGKYIQNISLDLNNLEKSLITYTENYNNYLVISVLEIPKYQRILDNLLGAGNYSIESANDLD